MRRSPIGRRHIRKAKSIIKSEGVLGLSIAALQRVKQRQQRKAVQPQKKVKFTSLVNYDDVVRARWSTHPYRPRPTQRKSDGPYSLNWVMSPPGASSGGHQNIFRFIKYLEDAGFKNRIYLYSTNDFVSVATVRENLAASYPKTEASIEWLKGDMAPADAIVATGWETAYPVFNANGNARRFYFVQDFEPFFYPMGSDYVLAENTYRFNFHGITAGGWLSDKLSKDYGMKCDHFDFGADRSMYQLTNTGKRKEIFFYARPVTTRRGFELGILALQIFHEKMPAYTITLAGWDVSEYDIPFPYKNLKALPLSALSEVYNRSAAALVVSLTNMSLMPLELLATGAIPVVTEGANNRKVSNNPYIKFAAASPDALAQALIDTVNRKDLPTYAKKAADSINAADWSVAGKRVVDTINRELHG
jgi:hypothetical protein